MVRAADDGTSEESNRMWPRLRFRGHFRFIPWKFRPVAVVSNRRLFIHSANQMLGPRSRQKVPQRSRLIRSARDCESPLKQVSRHRLGFQVAGRPMAFPVLVKTGRNTVRGRRGGGWKPPLRRKNNRAMRTWTRASRQFFHPIPCQTRQKGPSGILLERLSTTWPLTLLTSPLFGNCLKG